MQEQWAKRFKWLSGAAMKFGAWVILPIIVSISTTVITNRVMQPSVNIHFEPNYPMLTPIESRGKYGDSAIAVKIETDGLLKNAIVRLIAISKNLDLSQPLNGFVQGTFGWPQGGESFKPRTFGVYEYIIIATESKSADGQKHLRFFLEDFSFQS